MKKTIIVLCAMAILVGLCACGTSSKTSNIDIVGTWISPDRSTGSKSTYTDQLGNEVVLEENSTNNYMIVFYDDGTYRETYSYENIKYDWDSNPPRRSKKSGENISNGTWKMDGSAVTLVSENGTTTKLTYSNGVLNSPKTSNYIYQKQG